MKYLVITWGFCQHSGTPYLDCYLEITDAKKDAHAIRMMELRGSTQGTTLTLLRVPKDCERKDMDNYIKYMTPETLALLKKAKVRYNDITRKGVENQAIDFILS